MGALRTGLVGLGWWGRELASAATRTPGAVALAAGYSPDPIEARAFAARFGVHRAESYEALLADAGIDAIVLATPHGLHADQIIAAACAGKHVFVEKPLTLTAQDARRAIAACREAGVTLAVGHNRRLLAQVDVLRRLLDQGVAGKVSLVEANYSTGEALRLPPAHWRRDPRECPGGAMTALGIHAIDWLHVLFGRVAQAQARFVSRATEPAMQDTATAILTFDGGLVGTLTCLYATPYTNRFVVHGSAARIAVEAAVAESETARPTLSITRLGGATEYADLAHIDTLALQLARWSAACRGEGTVAVSGAEAARNVAVLEAMTHSAANDGAPVMPDYAEVWD